MAHLEPKVVPLIMQDLGVKISTMQVQHQHPLSGIQAERIWAKVSILNLSMHSKVLRG